MTQRTATHELIGLDPATGEEDQLVATGTQAAMHTLMADLLEDAEIIGDQAAYRVQPA